MKVSKATIIRTVILMVTLANMLLVTFGKDALPFDEASVTAYGETIYQGVSAVLAIGASLWAWWKNNSFTQEAIMADEIMKNAKEA